MQDIRVNSWTELMEVLHGESWNPALRRFRSPYVFRGQGHDAPLTTSLQRLAGNTRDIERHLVRAFRKYAEANVKTRDLLWYWLSLGQHHGLPTRLLDWTYSPLVALHFATAQEERFDQDGVIWMLNAGQTNQALPQALSDLLRREGASVFTVDMLELLGTQGRDALAFDAEMTWLDRMEAESGQPFLLFLEPPSLDQRIVQQSALFSVLSDPEMTLDVWLSGREGAARRIILPAALKWEVRDKLDGSNITERTLFPDLNGLSQWLRRYYRLRDDGVPSPDEPAPESDRRQQH
ncbi:FRG domain-containing protein [Deinococcus deserti]|uniref:FRG domain-containing protein n=1 Tax=Deinococcus deserti (strain DSM 17065 / CIP 109153 / LMG 22923 / VCD115) TaxID=546414 RepID=C1D303_DEIDV|nr:FRG domain-containing protein [Deinococcus deserti]ACO47792.1 hypothetical protein Deide_2p01250 [Deinococcus deserti VCD115]